MKAIFTELTVDVGVIRCYPFDAEKAAMQFYYRMFKEKRLLDYSLNKILREWHVLYKVDENR